MHLKKYILFAIFFFALMSCGRQSDYHTTLCGMEAIMESRPDSARAVLESMDATAMSGKNRAKHALLLSMALDKTNEDREDFEILQPAIDYYEKHGSATDRLRTFYYQGRIYRNCGDNASAMACMYKAADLGEESSDVLTKARLLVVQGNIYESLAEFENACTARLQASEYFHNKGRIDSYVNCLLAAICCFNWQNDYENAKKYLDICKRHLTDLPVVFSSSYYSAYLIWLVYYKGTDDEIRKVLAEYLSEVPADKMDYNTVGLAWDHVGEYEKALEALLQESADDENRPKRKHAILADIYEHLGRYKEAMECYQEYCRLDSKESLAMYEQNAGIMEDRHELELAVAQERIIRSWIVFSSIIVCMALVGAIIYARYRLKIQRMRQIIAEQELERYKMQAAQLAEERDSLSSLLTASEGELNKEVLDAISNRLGLLNHFLTASITNDSKVTVKADEEISRLLKDKESFIASTRLAFTGTHPHFVKYLEKHGLTDREIELCCLYALGLNGKDIGAYANVSSQYNISSSIRSKLGIDAHGTNLCLYIRRLLKPDAESQEDSVKA